ncbi:C-terminal binding protein [Bartonella taylorii]|uniref:C-terminal binding protein n=1 Tax=Bartonella taylorii TaxID=33046 RepID=UPI001ABA1D8A|nr:C-terminal binding protein [Bartonella taylorii]
MKIAITDRITEISEFEKPLTDLGAEFYFFNTLNEEDFPTEILEDIDALLIWHAKITEKTAKKLRKCKIAVRFGIGYDQVDYKALRRHGVEFANNPSYCIDEVADTALTMILEGCRQVSRHNDLAKKYDKTWQENNFKTFRLKHKTIGLIGLGKIGKATLERLSPFGCKVIVYDPYIDEGLAKSLNFKLLEDIDYLLEESDVVSLHCPLTKKTTGMINSAFLKKMKKNGILVNTARGKILSDFDCLEKHLRENPEFHVLLDVLPMEPPRSHPLIKAWRDNANWLSSRLVINPHNAYFSESSHIDMRKDIVSTVISCLYKKKMKNLVVSYDK